ncbi:uncharacterized protein LOC120636203 isoform X2 [Pararge aegeria]|uniref:uncharacterized protein LOC120636203 isoform X2 n=1 Tax=Pararge aegeria TaxID=116150 RepID=UPI0019CF8A36|nr:uncharacterized protein LOC120636203 isoform X2 [Pararge aegeria]
MFMKYSPPIMKRKTTCVGLALDLLKRWHVLEKDFPGIGLATSIVSCEESVQDVREYVMMGDGPYSIEFAEKEHVVVCTQVIIDGRPGVMLADPGYHLSKLITVMYDKMYPNTGWFHHPGDPNCNRDNAYGYNSWNSNYVEWRDRTDKGESVKSQTSLIYVAQPFLDAINITERRNLVYNLRSLVARDAEGHLLAGMCFRVINKVERATFTLFVNNGVEKVKDKYSFYEFREPHNEKTCALGGSLFEPNMYLPF